MPVVVNPLAKIEVFSSNRSRDKAGSQNSKSKSRDPLPTSFDLIVHFLVTAPLFHQTVRASNLNAEGSRDPILKFQDPSMPRERFELETSNLSCALTIGGNKQKMKKIGQRGRKGVT